MILGYIYGECYEDIGSAFKYTEVISDNKPTLIIGWKRAKELYPEDFSINRFKIKENIYWTFSKYKDRMLYKEKYDAFCKLCVEIHINSYNYQYIDLFQVNYKDIEFSSYNSILFWGELIYLKNKKSIIGISPEISKHLGYNLLDDIEKAEISKFKVNKNFSYLEGYKIMCF